MMRLTSSKVIEVDNIIIEPFRQMNHPVFTL